MSLPIGSSPFANLSAQSCSKLVTPLAPKRSFATTSPATRAIPARSSASAPPSKPSTATTTPNSSTNNSTPNGKGTPPSPSPTSSDFCPGFGCSMGRVYPWGLTPNLRSLLLGRFEFCFLVPHTLICTCGKGDVHSQRISAFLLEGIPNPSP